MVIVTMAANLERPSSGLFTLDNFNVSTKHGYNPRLSIWYV